jgi:hypothetical protein
MNEGLSDMPHCNPLHHRPYFHYPSPVITALYSCELVIEQGIQRSKKLRLMKKLLKKLISLTADTTIRCSMEVCIRR